MKTAPEGQRESPQERLCRQARRWSPSTLMLPERFRTPRVSPFQGHPWVSQPFSEITRQWSTCPHYSSETISLKTINYLQGDKHHCSFLSASWCFTSILHNWPLLSETPCILASLSPCFPTSLVSFSHCSLLSLGPGTFYPPPSPNLHSMSEKFILLFMQLSLNSQPLYPTTYLMFVLECLICQLKTNLQNLIIPPILLTCSFSSISKLLSNTTIHLPSCSNQKPRVILLLNY